MDQELYQIIEQAKRGDKKSFEQLISVYKGKVFRHAYAMLGDWMEAEDVSQEAFIKAYVALSKLQSAYAFSSWLAQIVSHLCHNRLSKKEKEKINIWKNVIDLQQRLTDSNRAMEQKQLQMNIEEAMQKLSSEQREAIVLRDIQGFSYEEMANILKIPVGTVKSRIHAARLVMREELAK
ncbi:RNA polymerase sigma factor [Microaerobacter geothermalis]|uniref:RNA polymerase sigma factor n=1 Tax=Microaerobacter geothermalis TaxID=674972 RepID=UPI001F1B8ED3|nr:RNA polymerase sigma factor [Microaerobacter geothermalis]MCF6093024.1 RNA polymerase sigma factor [Microaerobacter geothermalis]